MARAVKIASVLLLIVIPIIALTAQGIAKNKLPDNTKTTVLSAGPVASWDTTAVDFGEIVFNTKKKTEFTLTNTGNQPLFIVYGQASCGCAHLEYSEAPIMPGQSTLVSVTYHGTDLGDFLKTVSMVTNADTDRTILQLKGSVVKGK